MPQLIQQRRKALYDSINGIYCYVIAVRCLQIYKKFKSMKQIGVIPRKKNYFTKSQANLPVIHPKQQFLSIIKTKKEYQSLIKKQLQALEMLENQQKDELNKWEQQLESKETLIKPFIVEQTKRQEKSQQEFRKCYQELHSIKIKKEFTKFIKKMQGIKQKGMKKKAAKYFYQNNLRERYMNSWTKFWKIEVNQRLQRQQEQKIKIAQQIQMKKHEAIRLLQQKLEEIEKQKRLNEQKRLKEEKIKQSQNILKIQKERQKQQNELKTLKEKIQEVQRQNKKRQQARLRQQQIKQQERIKNQKLRQKQQIELKRLEVKIEENQRNKISIQQKQKIQQQTKQVMQRKLKKLQKVMQQLKKDNLKMKSQSSKIEKIAEEIDQIKRQNRQFQRQQLKREKQFNLFSGQIHQNQLKYQQNILHNFLDNKDKQQLQDNRVKYHLEDYDFNKSNAQQIYQQMTFQPLFPKQSEQINNLQKSQEELQNCQNRLKVFKINKDCMFFINQFKRRKVSKQKKQNVIQYYKQKTQLQYFGRWNKNLKQQLQQIERIKILKERQNQQEEMRILKQKVQQAYKLKKTIEQEREKQLQNRRQEQIKALRQKQKQQKQMRLLRQKIEAVERQKMQAQIRLQRQQQAKIQENLRAQFQRQNKQLQIKLLQQKRKEAEIQKIQYLQKMREQQLLKKQMQEKLQQLEKAVYQMKNDKEQLVESVSSASYLRDQFDQRQADLNRSQQQLFNQPLPSQGISPMPNLNQSPFKSKKMTLPISQSVISSSSPSVKTIQINTSPIKQPYSALKQKIQEDHQSSKSPYGINLFYYQSPEKSGKSHNKSRSNDQNSQQIYENPHLKLLLQYQDPEQISSEPSLDYQQQLFPYQKPSQNLQKFKFTQNNMQNSQISQQNNEIFKEKEDQQQLIQNYVNDLYNKKLKSRTFNAFILYSQQNYCHNLKAKCFNGLKLYSRQKKMLKKCLELQQQASEQPYSYFATTLQQKLQFQQLINN